MTLSHGWSTSPSCRDTRCSRGRLSQRKRRRRATAAPTFRRWISPRNRRSPAKPLGHDSDVSTVPAEFSSVARSLRRLAAALLRTFREPTPGSAAHGDTNDRTYDDEWGRVLFEYVHDVSPYVALLHDHLRALGAVIAAEGVAMAHVTLSRSVLETASFVYWFYDPEISSDEKVRRHINLRLERNAAIATQQLLLNVMEPGRELSEPLPHLEEIRASLYLLEEEWVEPKVLKSGRVKPGRIGASSPSMMELLRGLQLFEDDDLWVSYSDHLYRMMSGVAHGADHSLAPFLERTGRTVEAGVAEGEVSLSLGALLAHTLPIVLAVSKMVRRLGAYRGLDLGLWTQVWVDVSPIWREYLSETRG